MSLDPITTLHCVFCSETNCELKLGLGEYSRERFWYEWAKLFTVEDLRLVIRHLQGKIRLGERRPGCLRFRNLIEDLPGFEEELAMAKAEQRNRKPAHPLQAALNQLRPAMVTQVSHTAKPVSEYISALRRAAE